MSQENLKYVTFLNEGFIVNSFLLYQFFRRLITPFEQTDAFKLGIIDKNGKFLKKRSELTTQAERDACGLFDVLLFNLKKIIEKLPFGKSKLASYATALWLLKEEKNLQTEEDCAILGYKFLVDIDRIQKDMKLVEEIANSVGAGGVAGIGQDAEENGPPVPKKKKEKEFKKMEGTGRKISFKEFNKKLKEDVSHSLNVGDILVNIWGSTMTIADFYVVQAVKNKSVSLQCLQKVTVGGDTWSPLVQPNGKQIDPKEKQIVKRVRDDGVVKMETGVARLWDGKPVREDHLD